MSFKAVVMHARAFRLLKEEGGKRERVALSSGNVSVLMTCLILTDGRLTFNFYTSHSVHEVVTNLITMTINKMLCFLF